MERYCGREGEQCSHSAGGSLRILVNNATYYTQMNLFAVSPLTSISSIQSRDTCTLPVSQPVMQISPTVHTALATALLIASLVRFELSYRAVRENSLYLTLDLAVSVPKGVLLVVNIGLSRAGKSAVVREVLLGITSVFPFLLVVRAIRLFLGFYVDH
jgi:hypothetical protein